jgi:hypothetical protein
MDNYTNRNEETIVATLGTPSRTSWGAIWAGVFTFIAIWTVFGMLGEAIFATSMNPNTGITGRMSVGMGIWCAVLTIVAMYVAGMVTGYLADISDRIGRIMHGMAMFGLAVFLIAMMVLVGSALAAGNNGVTANNNPQNMYMLSVFSDVGWAGFVALLLGWLAAIGGAAQRRTGAAMEERVLGERRRAA